MRTDTIILPKMPNVVVRYIDASSY